MAKNGVNGKRKGSGFERTIANLLSQNLNPLKFRKTEGSGAIVGGLNSKIIENFSKEALRLFVGDVAPSNESSEGVYCRFCIECKFYKDQDKLNVLLNGKTKIHGWMDEIREDAKKLDIHPILIFKFNNTPVFVCIESTLHYPQGVQYLTLTNGDKVAHFDDVLAHKEWWLV